MKVDLAKYGLVAALPEAFDHSFTGTYLECERMAYYQNILGRRGVREQEYALAWGSVFHKIAEIWVTTHDLNQCLEVIEQNIPEDNDDRYGRDQGRMQEAFMEWVKYRAKDPIEILHAEQPVLITCDSKCPYSENGCGLTYGGRVDQIVRWNALIGPLDIKTTVMTEQDPIAMYRPNHQMPGYIWAATHLLGKHCWGAIVERVIINKSKIQIGRFPIPYTRDAIMEWVENEKRTHEEIIAKFQQYPDDEGAWKQNYARCYQPYNCAYRDACLSPRDAGFRLRWLRDNTEERRFDFQQERGSADAKGTQAAAGRVEG